LPTTVCIRKPVCNTICKNVCNDTCNQTHGAAPPGGGTVGDLDMQHHDGTSIAAALLGDVTWRKSQASNPNGDCVELADLDGGAVAVRNSRDPRGPALIYTRAEIAAFIQGAKDGEFDDLAV
jgi:hypothetical protein